MCFDHLGNKFSSVEEMCKYHKVSVDDYQFKIKFGFSVEEALKNTSFRHGTKCYDHLGNEYSSIKEMCDYYGISCSVYASRIKRGWLKSEALCIEVGEKRLCRDHLGNKYNSTEAMCLHYNISTTLFRSRIKRGWTIKKALTLPTDTHVNTHEGKVVDHNGNKYKSVNDMCRHYGISTATYYSRLSKGYSSEESLTLSKHTTCTDHLGNEFDSIKSMCEKYKIPVATFQGRIAKGWTLESALTTEIGSINNGKKCHDSLGHSFNSINAMCKYHNVDTEKFRNRIHNGWSIDEALEISSRETNSCKDHLGNEFKSQAEMCRAYGIKYNAYKNRISRGWSKESALTIKCSKKN